MEKQVERLDTEELFKIQNALMEHAFELSLSSIVEASEVLSIVDELLALREATRWIPITPESFPKGCALFFTPTDDTSIKYRIAPSDIAHTLRDATHWQHLPAPPVTK